MTDFYTGSPMDPDDLWFRDAFIDRLWEILRGEHVLLTAPRRTGKTSVMDHLAARPRDGFCPVSVFVQDLDHPNEFLLTLLDAFHAKHPQLFRQVFQSTTSWIGSLLDRVQQVDVAGFKVAMRAQLPSGPDAWKELGDQEFFPLARRCNHKLLFIVDEFPDLIVNMGRNHPTLVRPFLGWLRGHCVNPRPKQDNLRWLLGGSVNLSSTLDALSALDLINALHEESLPILTTAEVEEFVRRMLSERSVDFDDQVPRGVAACRRSFHAETALTPPSTGLCRSRSLKGNSSIAQGSPHRGYPGLGTAIECLNSEGVRFTQGLRRTALVSVSATDSAGRIRPAVEADGAPEAIPFRDESSSGIPTQGSRCAANPGLWKNVPSGHAGDVAQRYQPVRRDRDIQRHAALSGGVHRNHGRGGSVCRGVSIGRTDLEVCRDGGLGYQRMSLQVP